jgi:hypothetical protein
MSCYNETFNEKNKKQEVFKHFEYLEHKECCNKNSCDKLSMELQDLQFKCDDLFRDANKEVDEKGLTKDTLCEEIKNMKIELSKKVRTIKGGKKLSRKKRSGKNRKMKKRKTRYNT